MEEEIRQIQRMLREISFFDNRIERVIPDGIYGSSTEASVRSFQRNNNLYETGAVDNDTWDKITEVYDETMRLGKRQVPLVVIDELDTPIRVGSYSESLYVIQAMMLALSEYFENINPIEVNGIFDSSTQNEVEKIQLISGITPNALIDREFVNALTELYNIHITRNRYKDSISSN